MALLNRNNVFQSFNDKDSPKGISRLCVAFRITRLLSMNFILIEGIKFELRSTLLLQIFIENNFERKLSIKSARGSHA